LQLSDVHRHATHVFSTARINAASRYISSLDAIPSASVCSKTVSLSNNFLQNLSGIDQFFNVETLSLANNRVSAFEELLPLRGCRRLQRLFLHGNPISSMPFYRTRVLSVLKYACVEISELDGKIVTREEWETVAETLQRHASILSVLLTQEVRIIQLSLVAKTLVVHHELLLLVFGRGPRTLLSPPLPTTPPFQVDLLLRYGIHYIHMPYLTC
jgi:hypothetical protein